MKKSVVVLILLIYAASVVIVSFFGMQVTSYNPSIYVEKVECTNDDIVIGENGEKYIIKTFDPDIDSLENVVILTWKVYPEDATVRDVVFEYEQTSIANFDKVPIIQFNRWGLVTVTIKPVDRVSTSDVYETVTIWFKRV